MSYIETMLINDEGLELVPYRCPSGDLTIGVGRNLDSVGLSLNEIMTIGRSPLPLKDFKITRPEALLLLSNDLVRCRREITRVVPTFNELSDPRKDVLLNMLFNLGSTRFRDFRKMLAAINRKDYVIAAMEMMDSQWSLQVKNRSRYLSTMMRTNEYPSFLKGEDYGRN